MNTKMNIIAAALLPLLILTGTSGNAVGNDRKDLNHEIVVEESIGLEGWMTKSEFWRLKSIEIIEETEEALNIENWMTESFNFEVSNPVDVPIQIENWMTDENIWKLNESEKEMAIEAWMTKETNWIITR
jgi:hypothetical protein